MGAGLLAESEYDKSSLIFRPAVWADENAKISGLADILHGTVIKSEHVFGDGKGNFPAFSGVQRDLLETFQHPHGPGDAGGQVAQVHLYCFRPGVSPGIGHGNGGGDAALLCHAVRTEPDR